MASTVTLKGQVLHWYFPPSVRNTAQDLERELANPSLVAHLRQVLPGLQRMALTFEAETRARPEDLLREDPVFQELLRATKGEIVEVWSDKHPPSRRSPGA